MKKKILFLYTELAQYFLSCIEELVKEDIEVTIIHWPVNKEAPFQFKFPDNLKAMENPSDLKELEKTVSEFNPDLIFTSGWIDKDYLKVCKNWKKSIPVIAGFDNKWTGGLKQRIASLFSWKLIKPYFSHAWVPDKEQVEFARRLGFAEDKIHTGFYSADLNSFNEFFEENRGQRVVKLPKRFIYIGRYYDFKGINDLWEAFSEVCEEQDHEWELCCIGTGDVEPFNHPKIKHIGFVQPDELENYLKDASVFVLPSHVEPWGVVVHEMAAAGFPLICSDKVGANKAFLQNNKNGFIFKASNKEELKSCLKKMIALPDYKILEMGALSHKLAQKVSPKKWTQTLLNILNQK